MTKTHYISFLAYITSDWVQLRKLYPEQEAAGQGSPEAGWGASTPIATSTACSR